MPEQIFTGEYKYLSKPQGELRRVPSVTQPFQVRQNDQTWEQVKKDATRIYNNKRRHEEDFESDPASLVAGTVNLLNTIIEKKNNGEPIDTLIFLDKSARNGAYMFTVAWKRADAMLKKQGGALPAKPHIRFINVGRFEAGKHHDTHAVARLGTLYRPEDINGKNVLIVDEVIATGESVRRAGEAILGAGYTPQNLEGMANFQPLPEWYQTDKVKGIADVGRIYESVRTAMGSLTPQEKTAIENGIRTEGWRKFIETTAAESWNTPWNRFRLWRSPTLAQAVNTAIAFAEKNGLNESELKQVIVHIASYGGFLGLSPSMEEKIATRRYRNALKFVVDEAFNRGLVQLAPVETPPPIQILEARSKAR